MSFSMNELIYICDKQGISFRNKTRKELMNSIKSIPKNNVKYYLKEYNNRNTIPLNVYNIHDIKKIYKRLINKSFKSKFEMIYEIEKKSQESIKRCIDRIKLEKYFQKLKKINLLNICKNYDILTYNKTKYMIINEIIDNMSSHEHTLSDINIKIESKREYSNKSFDHVIHLADIHIRRNTRIKEYKTVFNNFLEHIKGIKNALVIICGDIFHFKTTQRAEGINLWNKLVLDITKIHPLVVILGNHDVDLNSNDTDWLATLDGIIDNYYYLNNSGSHIFGNIHLGVSSLLDSGVYSMKRIKDKVNIQLYHGTINGSKVFNNTSMESDIKVDDFGFYDLLLLGDIHKHQFLKSNVAYSGSLIQQNKGENIFGHGFIKWDLSTLSGEFIEVNNPYGFVKIYVGLNDLEYDDRIHDSKKYLYANFYLNYQNTLHLVEDFKSKNNFRIINTNVEKCYIENSVNIKLSSSLDNNSLSYLDGESELIKKIHSKISNNEVLDLYKSKWIINEMSFRSVFNYNSGDMNVIRFDKKGFYKIFGENFIGKTTIINIIKWGLFGSDSSILSKDIFNKNGLIKISFQVGNCEYILERRFENSGKLNSKLSYDEKIIMGNKNVDACLNEVIGDYDQFEMVSSINNYDFGVLKCKNNLKIFQRLFKLDKFKTYELKTKDMITDIKTKLSVLNDDPNDYEKDIKRYRDELIKNVELLSNTYINPFESELNKSVKKLEMEYDNISIMNINSNDTKDLSNDILKISNELKLFDKNLEKSYENIVIHSLDNYNIHCVNNKLKSTKILLNNLPNNIEEQIESVLKSIVKVDDIDFEKDIKKLSLETKDLKKNYDRLYINRSELDDELNELLKNVKPMNCDEEFAKKKMSGFDYKKNKKIILNIIDEGKNIDLKYYSTIKKLLTEPNYYDIYQINKNNVKYKKRINEIKILMKDISLELKKCDKTILMNNSKIHNYKICIKNRDDNKRLLPELKSLKSKLKIRDKLKSKYESLVEKQQSYNKYLKLSKENEMRKNMKNRLKIELDKKNNLKKDLELLSLKQKNYELYIKYKSSNDKNIKLKNECRKKLLSKKLLLELVMKNNNKNNMKKLRLENIISNTNKLLNESISLRESQKNISNERSKLLDELSVLNRYKTLVSERGVPSDILNTKIPLIESSINKFLSIYTNFKISIEINGKGNCRKIKFYQIKNKNGKKISISCCSGYEMFILNIAFKIAIKNNCYVNYSNFICIDEVWEKISENNYNKLYNIFNILKNNYDNVLVISHIQDIKNILDEEYEGKFIKIDCDKGVSKII